MRNHISKYVLQCCCLRLSDLIVEPDACESAWFRPLNILLLSVRMHGQGKSVDGISDAAGSGRLSVYTHLDSKHKTHAASKRRSAWGTQAKQTAKQRRCQHDDTEYDFDSFVPGNLAQTLEGVCRASQCWQIVDLSLVCVVEVHETPNFQRGSRTKQHRYG